MIKKSAGWLERVGREECGAAALEFAIVGSAFIIVSIGTIEFGRSLQVRNEMAYAMDHGARTVMMNPDATESAIATVIKERLNGYNDDNLVVKAPTATIACETDGKAGTMATRAVSLSYTLQVFIPLVTDELKLTLERTVPTGQCV